jgi:hypothetical protein
MYLCILDGTSQTVLHRDYPAEPGAFLDAIAPYRAGPVQGVECLTNPCRSRAPGNGSLADPEDVFGAARVLLALR